MTRSVTTPFLNPAARRWRPAAREGSALPFHRSLPGYTPTPLAAVPSVAAALGVRAVLVKDESARLGLSASNILGASYAIARALSDRCGLETVNTLSELRAALTGTSGRYTTRHRLMGKCVIRFFVERERVRVGGIGAFGLPGASSGGG